MSPDKNHIKVLFLCTEPAGYFLNCIRRLQKDATCSVMLVHWPPAPNAPFNVYLPDIEVVDKSKTTFEKLVNTCSAFAPEIVYVAGWVDQSYLRIAKGLRLSGAVIVGGLDNPWKGTLRQRISCLFSRLLIHPYFDYLWVPGSKQRIFAQQLGFAAKRILSGIYVADIENFTNTKRDSFKKYLVFVGRFEREKGVDLLIDAFASLTEPERNGWELRMIGNGSLRTHYRDSGQITFEDFMQPDVLAKRTSDAGGFILPSTNEPWGVVVQEFAAAGLPLILSDAVNSGEAFLIHGHNGFVFKNGDKESLKRTLIDFFQLDEATLKIMGKKSYDLAMKLTPHHWIDQLKSVLVKERSLTDME